MAIDGNREPARIEVRYLDSPAEGRPWVLFCDRCGGYIGSASEQEIAERMKFSHAHSHDVEDTR